MLLTFEMNKEDRVYANQLLECSNFATGIIEPKSFSGSGEFLQLGIVLSPAIATGVATVISEMLKNQRKVDIKVGNVEVKGLTEENALKILQQLLEQGQYSVE